MINSYPLIMSSIRISVNLTFNLQPTVIQNNTKIEVTGNSFHSFIQYLQISPVNSEFQ